MTIIIIKLTNIFLDSDKLDQRLKSDCHVTISYRDVKIIILNFILFKYNFYVH